jgi:hypothetical protein
MRMVSSQRYTTMERNAERLGVHVIFASVSHADRLGRDAERSGTRSKSEA